LQVWRRQPRLVADGRWVHTVANISGDIVDKVKYWVVVVVPAIVTSEELFCLFESFLSLHFLFGRYVRIEQVFVSPILLGISQVIVKVG